MNVLGVCFDSNLSWSTNIANTIKKANKALTAIKMIKKILHPTQIAAAFNFKCILHFKLYYNLHLQILKLELKQQLESASALALKNFPKNMTRWNLLLISAVLAKEPFLMKS